MDTFVIDHNIPLPGPRQSTTLRFPFALLEVGDSFFVPGDKNAVSPAAFQYAKRHGKKFTVRKVEGGHRVWRLS